MTTELEDSNNRMLEELQELVAMEVRDILATAAEEGFAPRDVVAALELTLQAEIAALADTPEAKPDAEPERPVESAAE